MAPEDGDEDDDGRGSGSKKRRRYSNGRSFRNGGSGFRAAAEDFGARLGFWVR